MYQVNFVVQWKDGKYEEIYGIGADWRAAKDNAIEIADLLVIILKNEGYRVLSDKEWRALPKPISSNNWR